MTRTPRGDESGLKKGKWTPDEDHKLFAHVTKYGSWNWRRLPKYAGLSRCGKSCRLRWLNYLRPNIKRGNFSKEEEDIIFRLHNAHGNKWSMIAAKLNGRTDNEIKNHWHTNLKRHLKNTKKPEKQKVESEIKQVKTSLELVEETLLINTTDYQILDEISQFSPPQPASSSEAPNIGTYLHDLFENDGGINEDFWKEPFFDDTFYMGHDYNLVPLIDTEIYYYQSRDFSEDI